MSILAHNQRFDAERASTQEARTVYAGQLFWLLPIRWWEPEDYSPERVVIQYDSDSKPQWDAEQPSAFNLLVWSERYGHDVYVQGTHCFDSKAECQAEMARRTEALNEQNRREVDEIVAEVLKNWKEV